MPFHFFLLLFSFFLLPLSSFFFSISFRIHQAFLLEAGCPFMMYMSSSRLFLFFPFPSGMSGTSGQSYNQVFKQKLQVLLLSATLNLTQCSRNNICIIQICKRIPQLVYSNSLDYLLTYRKGRLINHVTGSSQ